VVDHRIAAGDGRRRFVRAAATVLLGEEAFQARSVLQAQIGSATGARIGEVLSARWSDIDLVRAVWIKPSHHTKQKRTAHLPLSAPAMALLAEMPNLGATGSPYLFPGNTADRPLQGIKKFWRSLTAMAGLDDYRLHGNRHTHASHLVSSGLSLELADDPLRAAAERFGSKVRALHDGRKAEIVPIGGTTG
jgi:integrase